MITIRRTRNDNENSKVLQMLKESNSDNSIDNGSIYYVVEDNSEIVGGCKFNVIDEYAIINFLVINENRRGENLGDGLLRAVLNYCSSQGVKNVFFMGDNHYFIKKGFLKVKEADEDLFSKIEIYTNSILRCDIEEFFKKGCCCKRS